MKICIPHEEGLALLGPLPATASVEVSVAPGDADFWVPPFLASPDVVEQAIRKYGLDTDRPDPWTI